MQRINRKSPTDASPTGRSTSLDSQPEQAQPVPLKTTLKKLAVFQSAMLALIIGLSCLLLIGLVLRYLHGGFAPGQPAGSTSREALKSRDAHRADSKDEQQLLAGQSGKDVHVQMGASGDMIRWRFQVEDENDRIEKVFVGIDGTAYIVSKSEKLGAGGQRLDAVSASGKLIGGTTDKQSTHLLAAGAAGAIYREEYEAQEHGVVCQYLSAYDLQGRRLWQAQMPHPFSGAVAMGNDGTVYAIGVTPQSEQDVVGNAHSCLCALKPTGEMQWTFEHEGSLYWPRPLEDGGALVWSCPRYDRDFNRPGSQLNLNSGPHKQQFKLLRIDREGQLRWSFDVGCVAADYATATAGYVCAQVIQEGAAISEQIVVLDLPTGRELARYPSGPLNAPPLPLPDGAVVFQNAANVLVKVSPQMQVLWTRDLLNPLQFAPLADINSAVYFSDYSGLVCLEADGSERFRIPTGDSDVGHHLMWGPDGMIYIPTMREVLAFQPE